MINEKWPKLIFNAHHVKEASEELSRGRRETAACIHSGGSAAASDKFAHSRRAAIVKCGTS